MSTATVAYPEPVPSQWADTLDLAAVLAGQGLDPSSRSTRLPAIRAAAARALAEGRALLAPAIATRVLRVERANLAEVVLADGTTLTEAAIVRTLSGSLQVLAAVCTIGDATDRVAARLMREDPVAAMAFDGLGTAAVNRLAAAICRELRTDAARSRQRTTAPLSPGQGDWPLEEGQRLLFDLVKPARIGVSLSESVQMRPCKSVSFLVGIGLTVNEGTGSGCAGCSSAPGCHYGKVRNG